MNCVTNSRGGVHVGSWRVSEHGRTPEATYRHGLRFGRGCRGLTRNMMDDNGGIVDLLASYGQLQTGTTSLKTNERDPATRERS